MRSPSLVSVHAPRSTPFESFSTTCKCIIGSGIMSLSYAFMQSGWLVGLACLAVMALASYATMLLMIDSVHLTRARMRRMHKQRLHMETATTAQRDYGSLDVEQTASATAPVDGASLFPDLPTPSFESDGPSPTNGVAADPDYDLVGYTQIAGVLYGRWGQRLVDATLVFAQVGCGTAFIALVFTNIQAVLLSYGFLVRLEYIALALFPVVLLLTLPRSTTYLAGPSHLGNLSLLVCIATIVYFGLTSPLSDFSTDAAFWEELPMWSESPYGLLLFFGVCAFSFAAHAEIVAVEADAKSRSSYMLVLPLATFTIFLLYSGVGVFGYACFGAYTHPNILLNLGDALYVNLVRIALSITLLVNFALAVLPASQALDHVFLGKAPVSEVPHQVEEGEEEQPIASTTETRAWAEERTLLVGRPNASSAYQLSEQYESVSVEPTDSPAAMYAQDAYAAPWPLDASSSSRRPPPPLSGTAASPRSAFSFAQEQAEEHQKRIHWYHTKGNVVRTLMVMLSFFIAVKVQNLGVLFSVVGSVAGGLLCFTLPPLFWWHLNRLEGTDLHILNKARLALQIVFGFALVSAGLIVIVEAARGRGHVPNAPTDTYGDGH